MSKKTKTGMPYVIKRFQKYSPIEEYVIGDMRRISGPGGLELYNGNQRIGTIVSFHNIFIFDVNFRPRKDCRNILRMLSRDYGIKEHNFNQVYIRPLELRIENGFIMVSRIKIAKLEHKLVTMVYKQENIMNFDEFLKYLKNKNFQLKEK